MPLILCIDTALQLGEAALATESGLIASRANNSQNDHAAWIHTAIKDMLADTGQQVADLSAIALSSGPGSYTGLRVGMATAKGLCYALNLPLITENTLVLTAMGVLEQEGLLEQGTLVCPMIDARRMEVFTAAYTEKLETALEPQALILEPGSLAELLDSHRVIFAGNGAAKWQNICRHPHAAFSDAGASIRHLAKIAAEKLKNGQFDNLAYAEPFYLKSVYIAQGPKQTN